MSSGRSFNHYCHLKKLTQVSQPITIENAAMVMGWLHRTGAPWRDIPERYGKHSTISSRFYRWRTEGLWQRIWENLMQQADAIGDVDWEVHFVDSTVVRAHQHAAGAKGSNSHYD